MFYILYKFLINLLLIIIIFIELKMYRITETIKNNNDNENKLKRIINFYKESLQLYIENREKFYLKGREYFVKLNGKIYNESNIITIQDKLNYLLIHESPENKTEIVDKILLRNYSEKILGKNICAPILKIYNDIDEIKLEELPDKFVLKCNHGSGMNIICEDKSRFDLAKAKQKLRNWMGINYGLQGFEYQYMNIRKKVFAEKFLVHDIADYKFNCFNGEPKFIRVKKHINGINLNNIYNLNWTLTNLDLKYLDFVRVPEIKIPKPVNLEKMINYARLLSSKFCFCRVDFYEVDGKVYLGELTFIPFNGFMNYNNQETRIYLGNLLNISKIKKV